LATMDTQSLYSCGFLGLSRSDSAWLREADFRHLLPVCCPGWAAASPVEQPLCSWTAPQDRLKRPRPVREGTEHASASVRSCSNPYCDV
jgi:hypothetical protein